MNFFFSVSNWWILHVPRGWQAARGSGPGEISGASDGPEQTNTIHQVRREILHFLITNILIKALSEARLVPLRKYCCSEGRVEVFVTWPCVTLTTIKYCNNKYLFRFRLACHGRDSSASYLPVTVFIQDINDNPPVFQSQGSWHWQLVDVILIRCCMLWCHLTLVAN